MTASAVALGVLNSASAPCVGVSTRMILGTASAATCSPSTMSALTASAASAALSLPRGGALSASASPVLLSTATAKKPRTIDLSYYNQLWYRLPELFRFFASGNLGNLCFFAIERGVYRGIGQIPSLPAVVLEHQDSVSFFLGYILQIVTQHLLHAWLVYGLDTISTREKYLKTLGGQASAYFTALLGSTALNIYLRQHMPKNVAFVTTLYLFAIINYFIVGWITRASIDDGKNNKSTPTTTEKTQLEENEPATQAASTTAATHDNTSTTQQFEHEQQTSPPQTHPLPSQQEDKAAAPKDILRGGAFQSASSIPKRLLQRDGHGDRAEQRLVTAVLAEPACQSTELCSQEVSWGLTPHSKKTN